MLDKIRGWLLVRLVLAHSELTRLRSEVQCHAEDAKRADALRWNLTCTAERLEEATVYADGMRSQIASLSKNLAEARQELAYYKEAEHD